MVTKRKENVQAILQGKCTECGSSDDNYQVTSTKQEGSSVSYSVECECGTSASIRITPDGLSSNDMVSYGYATWK